jgi:hypothetical protein
LTIVSVASHGRRGGAAHDRNRAGARATLQCYSSADRTPATRVTVLRLL